MSLLQIIQTIVNIMLFIIFIYFMYQLNTLSKIERNSNLNLADILEDYIKINNKDINKINEQIGNLHDMDEAISGDIDIIEKRLLAIEHLYEDVRGKSDGHK